MFCKILSGGVTGIQAGFVWVEVDMDSGLPSFTMVGSLGNEVRESRERVGVALKNTGFSLPASRVTVNLAPADRHKEGTGFDLPIAVGLLQAMDYFPKEATEGILFLGELGLSGELKKVRGVLPIVRAAKEAGIRECIVPAENAVEGAVIPGICVRGAENILQIVDCLQEGVDRERILPRTCVDRNRIMADTGEPPLDFAHVCGQQTAKRGAEIAAAGFHNLLMVGPPGAGKSMIAKRIPGILPPLLEEECLEVTGIYSVAGKLEDGQALVTRRPFQSPHHTITQTALIGGGKRPRPGLISLSHRGVLFLDELPEFSRDVIDALRQPLEDAVVQVARLDGNIVYPADVMFVAAMNPCPCGFYPDRNRCQCTQPQILRYRGKISGPILDRMDLCVELKAVEIQNLQGGRAEESSAKIRARVEGARMLQRTRFAGTMYRFNADIGAADVERFCALRAKEKKLMEKLYESMGLGARGYHRILKVARTIADLAGEEWIAEEHLLEAAGYRLV
ncbi:MAG: YifB family Mg chelatase-like AAA ATPase [Lachnospiraceae bacterium]|nr:YifB family Mg chelatase-like AAA ATPase [Lachnospiraceae bacterium]